MAKKGVHAHDWTKKGWAATHDFGGGVETKLGAADAMLLGGKGANLHEMARLGLPVPTGFVIDTEVCERYQKFPGATMYKLMGRVKPKINAMTRQYGYTPLVSVRSGAPVSMPGMMDTIPNVGLTPDSLPFWTKRLGARTALDCYRRLVEEYGAVVHGINREKFHGDDDLTTEAGLAACLTRLLAVFKAETGSEFPESFETQLRGAIDAVFKSWNNKRARDYRRDHRISEKLGTAVVVQTMVFGNAGDDSGTGVLFTRCPSTGEPVVKGEFLANAQGEDVVAGIRTPLPLEAMAGDPKFKAAHDELMAIVAKLEAHYRDMQDVEFTVEKGKLWILQTRSGKRAAPAAFRIAVDMVDEKTITVDEALARVTPEAFSDARRPRVRADFTGEPSGEGLAASPGFAKGKVVKTSAAAEKADGPVILVRAETDPDDYSGMVAAAGILTAKGGMTSHAAVVARAMNKPAVTGLAELDGEANWIDGLNEGELLTIDGSTGRVWRGVEVPTEDGAQSEPIRRMIGWGYERVDAIPTSAVLTGGAQRVPLVAWALDDELRKVGFARLAAMTAEDRETVILEARSARAARREEDAVLYGAFGVDGEVEEDAKLDALLLTIATTPSLSGATIWAGEGFEGRREMLRQSGFRVGGELRTIKDLLAASGPVEPSPELVATVGGQEVYAELVAKLTQAGALFETLPPAMTPEQVAAAVFGKGA